MTTEEYETTIRPALAKFCGWDWSEEYGLWLKDENNAIDEHSIHCPDPLHNPADAWALLCTLLRAGYDVGMDVTRAGFCCDLYLNAAEFPIWHDTPEVALVFSAWEIVRQTAERPSGE